MIRYRLNAEKRGATGSGYALTVGLISIVALGAVTGAGGAVTELFGGVGDTLIEVAEANLSMTPGSASGMNITSGPAPAYSSSVNFSIKNIGNSPTAALTASLTNATDFVIDSDGCSGDQLQSGATCVVAVSMVATANGSYSGALRVGGGAKFVEAPLSGTASGLVPASLSVDQPSVSSMDVAGPGSPATGTPVTLTFTNDGEVTTGTLTTTNSNPTNFTISSDTCNGQTLAGSASCTMQVTPQSSTGGAMTGSVGIGDGSISASSSLAGTANGWSIYAFTSHTFTTCGVDGTNTGPTLAQCRSQYGTSWDENSSYFTQETTGIQRWTIPETATYRITVAGAGNQNNNSLKGARLSAEFALTQGDYLHILVGQRAPHSYNGNGGTFVATGSSYSSADPLIVAGGAAGDYGTYSSIYSSATFAESYYPVDSSTPNSFSGPNGQNGNGGGSYHGGGGGGFYSNATCNGCSNAYGKGFRQGGIGGTHSNSGGFGGGGGYHGGANGAGAGGGYSGGRGGYSSSYYAFGGSSYVAPSGSNRVNIGIDRLAAGYVTIEKL